MCLILLKNLSAAHPVIFVRCGIDSWLSFLVINPPYQSLLLTILDKVVNCCKFKLYVSGIRLQSRQLCYQSVKAGFLHCRFVENAKYLT